MSEKSKVFYGGVSTNWLHEKVMKNVNVNVNVKSKSIVDVQFVKKNLLGNGYLSTDEQRGVWSNLLLALALQFPFVCYLRFRLSR